MKIILKIMTRNFFFTGSEKGCDKKRSVQGFSIMELMVGIVILSVIIVEILQVFIFCSHLTESSKFVTRATGEAQAMLEDIRNRNFSTLCGDFACGGNQGNVFDLTQLPGRGFIYLDNSVADMLEVEIVTNFITRNGRVFGEDTNNDGILQASEDLNSNGKVDSTVHLATYVARR